MKTKKRILKKLFIITSLILLNLITCYSQQKTERTYNNFTLRLPGKPKEHMRSQYSVTVTENSNLILKEKGKEVRKYTFYVYLGEEIQGKLGRVVKAKYRYEKDKLATVFFYDNESIGTVISYGIDNMIQFNKK